MQHNDSIDGQDAMDAIYSDESDDNQSSYTLIKLQDDDINQNNEDLIYSPIDDDLNFFDLSLYKQQKLIGISNHRVHLYETDNP